MKNIARAGLDGDEGIINNIFTGIIALHETIILFLLRRHQALTKNSSKSIPCSTLPPAI